MAKFIACYDLNDRNDPHQNFMDAAERHGWEPWILGSNGKWYKVPNTTLIGTFDSQDVAVTAFKRVRADAENTLGSKITVEKWIVAQYSTATFDSDNTIET